MPKKILDKLELEPEYGYLKPVCPGRTTGWWYFDCKCKNICLKRLCSVKSGATQSCGCLWKEKVTKHGLLRDKNNKRKKYINDITYNSWMSMKTRCLNPDHEKYFRYGGAGIKICDQWIHDFVQFRKDMGERPSKEYTIHRIKEDGDYTPENCVWAKIFRQNRERAGCGIKIEYEGYNLYITEWSEITGLSYSTINSRRKRSLSPKEILTTPSKNCPNPKSAKEYLEWFDSRKDMYE